MFYDPENARMGLLGMYFIKVMAHMMYHTPLIKHRHVPLVIFSIMHGVNGTAKVLAKVIYR